jgi:hypothetical protein
MSAMAEQARARAKSKVERLTRASSGAVDASGWKELTDEKGDVQTGPRPISRRQFRSGGKVSGEHAKYHAGRKPRASGGMTANEFQNRDLKAANESREGSKHIGGMKKGGRAHKATGGNMTAMALPQAFTPVARKDGGKCGGGPVGKKSGGALTSGTRPEGGRIARKGGGRAKKGMNVNIIIAPSGPHPGLAGAAPPMPPPAGGPVGLRQGVPPPAPMMPPGGAPPPMGPPPMARKSGGRAYPISNGAGGGKGRLEKIRAYG